MPSIYNWSTDNATNATADGDLTWAEGQAPSTVNNSARQMMVRGKELLTDIGGSLTVGGTANAITLTAQSAFTTVDNGRIVSFKAMTDNTAATTLNVNAIGSKAVVKMTEAGEAPLTGAEIQSGGIYTAQYTTALDGGSGAWLLMNPTLPLIPPGSMMDYAGTTAPGGWLLCYGQAISRTTFAALFAALSTTYGVGDGSTTFNVPDARGRVIAGKDDMGGTSADRLTNQSGGVNGDTLGGTGGAETHTLTTAQLAAHSHGVTDPGHSHNVVTHFALQSVNTGSLTQIWQSDALTTTGGSTTGITIQNAGSGSAHNNTQPTLILNKIIKI